MAKTGRPRNTNDMTVLIQRMLKKRDVDKDGKSRRRLDVLIELLWVRVLESDGRDKDSMKFLLSYGFGNPVTADKLPEPEQKKAEKEVIEIPDHIVELLAAVKAEGKK